MQRSLETSGESCPNWQLQRYSGISSKGRLVMKIFLASVKDARQSVRIVSSWWPWTYIQLAGIFLPSTLAFFSLRQQFGASVDSPWDAASICSEAGIFPSGIELWHFTLGIELWRLKKVMSLFLHLLNWEHARCRFMNETCYWFYGPCS